MRACRFMNEFITHGGYGTYTYIERIPSFNDLNSIIVVSGVASLYHRCSYGIIRLGGRIGGGGGGECVFFSNLLSFLYTYTYYIILYILRYCAPKDDLLNPYATTTTSYMTSPYCFTYM